MIDSEGDLRRLYAAPTERVIRKQLDRLDRHCRRFIELSPFVVIASGGGDDGLDASPRGGSPGFVVVVDAHTLLIPDAPGNNRLDTLANVARTGQVGLLFLMPGLDETLRVNGRARVSDDGSLTARFTGERRVPKCVIEVAVTQAYLHCAKAFMRSKLWGAEYRVDPASLPTIGQMISEQTGIVSKVETRDEMIARYTPDL